jgi:hypothetical protein
MALHGLKLTPLTLLRVSRSAMTNSLKYGIPPLHDDICQLSSTSTNEEIDKVINRLRRGIDKSLEDITINGQLQYDIRIMGTDQFGHPDAPTHNLKIALNEQQRLRD